MTLLSRILAAFLCIFGVLSLKSGGSVLIDEAAKVAAGNVIPFIVWFNTLLAPLYLVAGVAVWLNKQCAHPLVTRLFVGYLLADGYLIYHILSGGLYEMRTVYAMTFRTLTWGGTMLWLKYNAQPCEIPESKG